MKFKKKPIVIEAWRYSSSMVMTEEDHNPPQWLLDAVKEGVVVHDPGPDTSLGSFAIKTLEGIMTATHGDWIIKGFQGELYPCKSDIFEATYEAVRDE